MPNENRKRSLLTLDSVSETAQKNLMHFGNHFPTVIVEGSLDVVITQIEQMSDTHEGRVSQMFACGLLLAQSGEIGVLQQVFFIWEGWLSSTKKKDAPFASPSLDPQRKEVLIVTRYLTPPPQHDGVIFEMHRNMREKIFAVKPIDRGADKVAQMDFRSPLIEAFVAGFLGSIS